MRKGRTVMLRRAARLVALAAVAALIAWALAWSVAVLVHLLFLRRWLIGSEHETAR